MEVNVRYISCKSGKSIPACRGGPDVCVFKSGMEYQGKGIVVLFHR